MNDSPSTAAPADRSIFTALLQLLESMDLAHAASTRRLLSEMIDRGVRTATTMVPDEERPAWDEAFRRIRDANDEQARPVLSALRAEFLPRARRTYYDRLPGDAVAPIFLRMVSVVIETPNIEAHARFQALSHLRQMAHNTASWRYRSASPELDAWMAVCSAVASSTATDIEVGQALDRVREAAQGIPPDERMPAPTARAASRPPATRTPRTRRP